MLNMLIVDDEPIIADGLTKLAECHCANRVHVYCAYSAREALRQSERIKLDIVLSDVLMPEMNGLQLQESILRRWRNCQFIFITGHNDFPYVRQALRNGSVSYVLKTEGDDAIRQAIDDALGRIDEANRVQTLWTEAQQQMQASFPLVRNQLFVGWLQGKKDTEQEMAERMEELAFSLNAHLPVLLVVVQFEEEQAEEINFASFSWMETIVSHLMPDIPMMSFQVGFSQQAFIFQGAKDFERVVLGTLEQAQEMYAEKTGRRAAIAASRTAVSWYRLDSAYCGLLRALRQSVGPGGVHVQNMDDTEELVLSEEHTLTLLRQYLNENDPARFWQVFDGFTASLNVDTPRIAARRAARALQLVTMICEACADLKQPRQINATSCLCSIGMSMEDQQDWRDCADQLRSLFLQLFAAMDQESKTRTYTLVNRLHEFISTHIDEDLSLSRLGEYVCYNASYLSTVYKNITGQTLIEYINNVRIEHAKTLLSDSQFRVRQIALACGFESQQYFNRLFKKKTGLTPVEYRENTLSV